MVEGKKKLKRKGERKEFRGKRKEEEGQRENGRN